MLLRLNGALFPISAGFGAIDSVHKTPHTGVDVAMPIGTELHAIADGVITKVDVTGTTTLGRMVRVKLEDGTDVIYGHLSRVNVKTGDHVDAGDLVGLSGNTGRSTGPHVHIQMVTDGANIDPVSYVAAAEPHGIMDRINGFADWFIGKETELLVKPATNTLADLARHALDIINANSAEIITFAIIVCAGGMMIGPLVGAGNKWVGRLFVTFWGGVIWRVIT
jgi:hypothetical protein